MSTNPPFATTHHWDEYDTNWLEHDMTLVSAALQNKSATAYDVADALCNLALQWSDVGVNGYRLRNFLSTAFNRFGKQNVLEITGRMALLNNEGTPLCHTIHAWCKEAIVTGDFTPCAYVQ